MTGSAIIESYLGFCTEDAAQSRWQARMAWAEHAGVHYPDANDSEQESAALAQAVEDWEARQAERLAGGAGEPQGELGQESVLGFQPRLEGADGHGQSERGAAGLLNLVAVVGCHLLGYVALRGGEFLLRLGDALQERLGVDVHSASPSGAGAQSVGLAGGAS